MSIFMRLLKLKNDRRHYRYYSLQLVLIASWVTGGLITALQAFSIMSVSEDIARYDQLSLVVTFLGGACWVALNTVIKAELWWGPEKITEVVNVLLKLERKGLVL